MRPSLDKSSVAAFIAARRAAADSDAVQPVLERGIDLTRRPVALLGLNGHFRADFRERAVPLLDLAALIDNRLAGSELLGLTIGDDDTLAELARREPALVTINTGSSPHFYRLAEALELPCLSLLRAYDLLGLHQPMAMFEGLEAEILDHGDELIALADRLADEASRQTLYRVIRYRLTHDLRELQAVAEPFDRQFYGNPFMALRPDEVLVEGGTDGGDSIRHFLHFGGGAYQEIIAFEPEPASFARLAAFAETQPKIRAVPKGLSNANGRVRVAEGLSMASPIALDGAGEIETCRIDDEVTAPVTLLKLDVEGAEMAALDGARETIDRHEPKLALAVYHRPEDLLRIPAFVERLGRDQRLYLRHHTGFHYDTTFYSIPD
jgi:FkbM family methyltransferase